MNFMGYDFHGFHFKSTHHLRKTLKNYFITSDKPTIRNVSTGTSTCSEQYHPKRHMCLGNINKIYVMHSTGLF